MVITRWRKGSSIESCLFDKHALNNCYVHQPRASAGESYQDDYYIDPRLERGLHVVGEVRWEVYMIEREQADQERNLPWVQKVESWNQSGPIKLKCPQGRQVKDMNDGEDWDTEECECQLVNGTRCKVWKK